MTDIASPGEFFSLADFQCSGCIQKVDVTSLEAAELQAGKCVQCRLCYDWLYMKEHDRIYLIECVEKLAGKGKAMMALCVTQLILLVLSGIYLGPTGSLITVVLGLAVSAMIQSYYGGHSELNFDLIVQEKKSIGAI